MSTPRENILAALHARLSALTATALRGYGFGGSGTTLIAAERTGRVARLVELDPIYCDVICRRYAAQTGVEPVLEATGELFEAIAETRATEAAIPASEAAE